MSQAYFSATERPIDPPPAEPLPEVRRLGCGFVVGCLILALIKLWLIHGEEIVARNAPLDDVWYLQSAQAWYWGRGYDHFAFMRPPVYPLFIAVSKLSGIPLRLTTELLLLAGAFALGGAMVKVGVNRVLGVLVFAAVVLSPWSLDVYAHPVPDTIYMPLLLFAVAAMGMTVASPSAGKQLIYSALAGVTLGLIWLTREEKVLIIPYVLCWFVVAMICRPDERRGWQRLRSDALTTLLIPGAMIALLVGGVCTANYARWGVFAASEVATSGFENANRALVRIKPQNWTRYVPVTTEARNRAFEVSPTFATLRPSFDKSFETWSRMSKDHMNIEGEVTAPWFFWYFREVVSMAGQGDRSARESNRFYQQIADEINAACDAGRLPSRRTINPFIDPAYENYAQYIPESVQALLKLFWIDRPPNNGQYVTETDELQEATPALAAYYDEMCQRRANRPRPGELQVSGWAFNAADPVVRVEVQGQGGKARATVTDFSPRPDVAAAFPNIAGVPEETGFATRSSLWPSFKRGGSIVFFLQSGGAVTLPFRINPNGQVILSEPADKSGVTYYIDKLSATPLANPQLAVAQVWLWRGHAWVVFALSCVAAVAMTVLLIQGVVGLCTGPKRPTGPIVAFLLICGFVVLGRVALFAIIRASSGQIDWTLRYMYPVAPLYTCLLLLTIWQAGLMLADWPREKKRIT